MTLPRPAPAAARPLRPAPATAPVLCTICGQRPRTILESKILERRDLCQPCHRAAMLAFLHPRPAPPALRAGLECPQHPGRPVILASARHDPQLAALGYTAEEVAAAGTLVRCAIPRCGWWAWEGLPLDPTLLPTPPAR